MTHEEIEEYLKGIEYSYEDMDPHALESLVEKHVPKLIEIIRITINYVPLMAIEDLEAL